MLKLLNEALLIIHYPIGKHALRRCLSCDEENLSAAGIPSDYHELFTR
jgi:hypothetical protein